MGKAIKDTHPRSDFGEDEAGINDPGYRGKGFI